ncbi:MAG: ABC transporter ATP-binding protein [Phycisphaerae bacterium]|nr:ABC transporter ATP-binding protein [Phycisphaerae bacterium]
MSEPSVHQGTSEAGSADSIILRVEGVHKSFRTGGSTVHALRGVSLEARRGEFIAIMGASGSGKSTLIHLIGGLDLPDQGRIVVEDHDISRLSDRQRTLFRRRRLGIIFQAYNLLPTLTAAENVALPLLVDGAAGTEIETRTIEAIRQVHLEARATHRPQAMSGGEQQRVAIARALLNNPALVLADEPTGNLDSKYAHEIWALLQRIAAEGHRTVIMVTHEAAAASFANRVIVLKDGEIIGQIRPEEAGNATLVAGRYQELTS